MIKKVFAVYDVKGKTYDYLSVQVALGVAVRWFSDGVNEPGTLLNKHPGDFILYQVGEFDDVAGELKSFVPPVHVVNGVDMLKENYANVSTATAGSIAELRESLELKNGKAQS